MPISERIVFKMAKSHILIAEDDDLFLSSITLILEDAGYRISGAVNGAKALEILKKTVDAGSPPDLLITDIHMPDMNGLQLLKTIWASGSRIPAIVMTGYGDRDTLKELIRIGCDDFLDKPFQPNDIRKKIEEVLEKNRKIKEIKNREQAGLIKKSDDLNKELISYKNALQTYQKELNTAVVTYQDMIRITEIPRSLKIAYKNRPLFRLGGDYLDIRNSRAGCDIFMADVTGHDATANYYTILLKAFFDENCRTGKDGADFLRILGRAVMEQKAKQRLITALFLRLNLKQNQGEAVFAGHPRIVKISTDNAADPILLGIPGSIVGLESDPEYKPTVFNLVSGDRLILFTDGVSNADYVEKKTSQKHFLKEDGIARISGKHRELPLDHMIESIWEDVMRFCRSKPTDDMLLAGIEIP